MRAISSLIAGVFIIFASMSAQAAGLPPGFDQNAWDNLLAKAVANGQQTLGPSGEDLRFLEHISPTNKQEPHQAEYLTLNGFSNKAGKYFPTEVSTVSEAWQKDVNGNWVIDQVIFGSSVTGVLARVFRTQIIETVNGQVIDSRTLPSGNADDAKEIQNWGQKINQWYGW